MTTGQEAATQSTAPIERLIGSRELMRLGLYGVEGNIECAVNLSTGQ